MDGGQFSLSRRALLGAAMGAPLLPCRQCEARGDEAIQSLPRGGSGLLRCAGNDEAEWRAALAAFEAAEGAVEEARRRCALAPRAGIGAAEDAFGDRLEALYALLRRLLTAPAPDLPALGRKIDLAFEHEVATLAGCAPGIAALRRDVRRLML
jgi:hypothetical protein